jgi:hypothetical protein
LHSVFGVKGNVDVPFLSDKERETERLALPVFFSFSAVEERPYFQAFCFSAVEERHI